MAIVTGDRYLESLVKFVENQADKLIEGALVLKLNPVGLRYVHSRLEALAELESLLAGAPVDYLRAYVSDLGDHRALEQLRRILRLLPSLKVVSVVPPFRRDPTPLYLLPFGRLKVLELRGCDLSTSAAKGLLESRFTLEKFICHNSTDAMRHVFASRIMDIKDSSQWNRLSFISCACNGLVLMDESLRLLPVVETLDLSRNKIAKVDNLRKCTRLKHVDLGFNNLRSITSFAEISCQIVKLVLRNNSLTSLHGIENLKSLQGLDLSYNVLSNFSEIEIDAMRHVFASRIMDIKDSSQWNRLSFISCACNGLVLMDESLRLLPVVETLDLSRNKIAKVDNLRKCTRLKHVDLGFNNLRSITSFAEISCQIVKLVLRNNSLTSLHGIENLKSLQGLDLSYNVLSNFSEIEIDAMRHVFASRIMDIKDSSQWNRLSFISCACNVLVLMDESLRPLPVVETLDLSRNKIAKVDNLRKCTRLKHLDLGFNNLRSITSFAEISCQIVKLVLRNNSLTSLHGIENLKSLQGLDLSYNVLSNFSEIEIVAGFPSLKNLWLEGNPICFTRWFRVQVFSLFSQPDQKRISRLVSIENDKQNTYICSNQDSVSSDNEFQSDDENANIDEVAEIEDLINRIEFMKKDHSVIWLQEFKERMNQTSENSVDGSKWNAVLYNNDEMLKSEIKDEDPVETSRCMSDSFQFSGDESSAILLESRTSFADASTVASAQTYFDQIGEAASRFFMGHAAGDRSVVKIYNVNQEESGLLNNRIVSADAGDSRFNSLTVPRVEYLSTKNVITPSTSLTDVNGSHLSSACPGSPPHYQEDILHRRRNLEEEFMQLSAESFSVASTDSNTSISEDDSANFGPPVTNADQSVFDNSSETSHNSFRVSPYRFDADGAYQDSILLLKQNGTHSSRPCAEGNLVNPDGRELESSASGSLFDAMRDDVSLGYNKEKTVWSENTKRRRKSRRRMIALPEEEDVHGDIDSSKKSSDHVEISQSCTWTRNR
ncbi:hypothetical protein OROGR_009420 [Orobanche gracilis]